METFARESVMHVDFGFESINALAQKMLEDGELTESQLQDVFQELQDRSRNIFVALSRLGYYSYRQMDEYLSKNPELGQQLELESEGCLVPGTEIRLADAFDLSNDNNVDLGEIEDDIDYFQLEEDYDEEAAVRLVNLILTDAIRLGAQEIHIEPYETEFNVRFRIDGVLSERMKPPSSFAIGICNRIMIMADLDIGRKKTAQLGKLNLILGNKKTTIFKVATLPIPCGVKIVLIDETVKKVVDLPELQVNKKQKESLKNLIASLTKPSILIVGSDERLLWHELLRSCLFHLQKPSNNLVVFGRLPLKPVIKNVYQVDALDDCGRIRREVVRNVLQDHSPDIVLFEEIDYFDLEFFISSMFVGKRVILGLSASSLSHMHHQVKNNFSLFFGSVRYIHVKAGRLLCDECKVKNLLPANSLICPEFDELGSCLVDGNFELFEPGKDACRECQGTGYKGKVYFYDFNGDSGNRKLAMKLVSQGEMSLDEAWDKTQR